MGITKILLSACGFPSINLYEAVWVASTISKPDVIAAAPVKNKKNKNENNRTVPIIKVVHEVKHVNSIGCSDMNFLTVIFYNSLLLFTIANIWQR